MKTRDTIQGYFQALSRGPGWEAFLADEMTFVSHSTPFKKVQGKDAFIESTRGFYSMIEDFEVQRMIVDGERACAVTRYALQPPGGDRFTCEVAELFTADGDRIASFDIYFDSAPFPARPGS